MAKGNDGNYFQHSIELAIACRLMEMSPDGRLHIALTHGMTPYEPCDDDQPRSQSGRLNDSLAAAAEPSVSGEAVRVKAYRATKASRVCYPNSGELLAAILDWDRLSGAITETCPTKCQELNSGLCAGI